jgi:plasmid stabilization system protein ParE
VKPQFEVRYSAAAREDLVRLFEYLLDQAKTADDFDLAHAAFSTIKFEVEERLSRTPMIYRKATTSPFLRELIIPFGGTGYVALYEVQAGAVVNILAVRHQLEDDYH